LYTIKVRTKKEGNDQLYTKKHYKYCLFLARRAVI